MLQIDFIHGGDRPDHLNLPAGPPTVSVPAQLIDFAARLSGSLRPGPVAVHPAVLVEVAGLRPADLLVCMNRAGLVIHSFSDRSVRLSADLQALIDWNDDTRCAFYRDDPDLTGAADLLGSTLRWFGHLWAPEAVPEGRRCRTAIAADPRSADERRLTLLFTGLVREQTHCILTRFDAAAATWSPELDAGLLTAVVADWWRNLGAAPHGGELQRLLKERLTAMAFREPVD